MKLFSIRLAQLLRTVFLSQSYEIYLEARSSKSIVVDIIVCLSLNIFSRWWLVCTVIRDSRLSSITILMIVLNWRFLGLSERCSRECFKIPQSLFAKLWVIRIYYFFGLIILSIVSIINALKLALHHCRSFYLTLSSARIGSIGNSGLCESLLWFLQYASALTGRNHTILSPSRNILPLKAVRRKLLSTTWCYATLSSESRFLILWRIISLLLSLFIMSI